MGKTTCKAINCTKNRILVERVTIAQDFRCRSVGLLNKKSLAWDEGLLIKPCNSIHTFFMKFPIDAIFLTKKGRVTRIATNLKPWRLAGSIFHGYMVLEICAGKSEESNTKVGDFIKIE